MNARPWDFPSASSRRAARPAAHVAPSNTKPDGKLLNDLVELFALVTKEGWWIPLDRYCELYRETREAIYNRRHKGTWQDGVHTRKVPGGGVWVNLLAVNAWAAGARLRESSKAGRRPRLPTAST